VNWRFCDRNRSLRGMTARFGRCAPPSTHSGLRPKPWAGSKTEVVSFPEPFIRRAVGWQLSAVPTAAGRLVSACLDRHEVSLDRHLDDCDANSSIGPAGCCSTCCIHETPADFAPRTGVRAIFVLIPVVVSFCSMREREKAKLLASV
jgi:hypothetical protein